LSRKVFTQPHVRLMIFDDQVVEENDRNWLLAKIRKYFPGAVLLYVAGSQSDRNEKRARTNGAQYYVSKPLSLERFGLVLQSFLQAENAKGSSINSAREISAMDAEESTVNDANRIGAGIRRLASELNSEDSDLRSCLLDAALAGLRLASNHNLASSGAMPHGFGPQSSRSFRITSKPKTPGCCRGSTGTAVFHPRPD
jgi:response regulator RpfG family c-di-GMP phosphodiesterase